MGSSGGKSRQTIGYWYHVLYHAGIGIGPIDAFLEFRVADKPAWRGELTESGTISINAPELLGGEKDQGGIVSDVDVMFGEADQMPNAYLLANLGEQLSAERGLATLVFKGGKYGAMNPYPQKPSYKIRKILQGWDGECWYPEKAVIGDGRTTDYDDYVAALGLDNWWKLDEAFPALYATGANSGAGDTPVHRHGTVEVGVASLPEQTYDRASVRLPGRLEVSGFAAAVEVTEASPFSLHAWILIEDMSAASHVFVTHLESPTALYAGLFVAVLSDGTVQASFGDGLGVNPWNRYTYTSEPGVVQPTTRHFIVVNCTPDLTASDNVLEVWVDGVLLDMAHTSGTATITAWPTGKAIFFGGTNFDPAEEVNLLGRLDQIGHHSAYLTPTNIELMHLYGTTPARQIGGWMNPAHVLYYARTHGEIGREPIANMNDASWRAAADVLADEGFGICTGYDPSKESLDEFSQRICKLIGGSESRSLVDGQWHLDLARGDYVLEDLPVLTDDDILEFSELPSTLDGAINSVSVKYFDPERKEDITTPPAQALALIDAFGTIHQVNEYPEIPNAGLAARIAERDLLAAVTPTRVFDLVCTREPYAWRPGTYFRLQAPKRGIADMVCILGEKQAGTLKSGAIKLKATQDIYGLGQTSYVEIEPGVDTRPDPTPVPITLQRAFEAPYIEVVQALSRSELAALPDDVGYLLTVAKAPAISRDYAVRVAPDGVTYASVARGDWCPSALIVEEAEYLDESFTITGGTRLDEVVLGQAALWDEEIVRVDAIDMIAGTISLARGCADTVRHEHDAASRIWFYDTAAAVDVTEYTAEEEISVKLLPHTGGQQLAEGAATPLSVAFAARQVRPYPPAHVQLDGEDYPDTLVVVGGLSVDARHRDRITQADQLIDQSLASIGPEPGTTYVVRNVDRDMDTETYLGDGIVSWPHIVPVAALVERNRLEVYSIRDGWESWQRQVREFDYLTTAGILSTGGEQLLDTGSRIIQET